MRLIDAEALRDVFDKYVRHISLIKKGNIPKKDLAILADCVGMIDNAPNVDAVPVRHGQWKVTPVYIKCSECGESFMLIPQNYCPNCGARMVKDDQID